MKKTNRKISLILSISIIIGIFSGCAIKKEAGATGENTSEPSWEKTFEITPEVTKEPATEENGKDTDGDKDKEENDKPEVTPEFYDFMTLDPDVDIENEHVREDIYKRIFNGTFHDNYIKNDKMNFTKKENYFHELYYKEEWNTSTRIGYYLKLGTTDFYSQNTKKKLNELGFEFGVSQSIETEGYSYVRFQYKRPDCSDEENIISLEKALKILLEDHNVVYVHVSYFVNVPK